MIVIQAAIFWPMLAQVLLVYIVYVYWACGAGRRCAPARRG